MPPTPNHPDQTCSVQERFGFDSDLQAPCFSVVGDHVPKKDDNYLFDPPTTLTILVMFVIQRVLEREGKLTLLDQNTVIDPHPSFRLFATANTVGLGDVTGLYHGTQPLNQGQLDRWSIVAVLNYLPSKQEKKILLARCPELDTPDGHERAEAMVLLANLVRQGFIQGDLSTVMSPRTLITWAENAHIFGDCGLAFCLSFYNRCDETEQPLVAEYYQRCFAQELAVPQHYPELF